MPIHLPAFLSRLLTCALVTGALLGATGCEDNPPDRPFEVGTGDDDFEDLDEEASVWMVAGDQGGTHLWISVRCTTCTPLGTVSYGVRDPESGKPHSMVGLKEYVKFVPEEDWRQAVGLTAFLENTSITGQRVELWAELEDDEGNFFKDAVEATVEGYE